MRGHDTTHDLDAEQALLGAVLQDPALLRSHLADFEDRWLYRPDHQALLRFLRGETLAGRAIDLVTLPRQIHAAGLDAVVGGLPYVLGLPDRARSTANTDHYAGVIRELYRRREVRRLAEELIQAAQTDDPEQLAERILSTSRSMLAAGQDVGEIRTIGDYAREALEEAGRLEEARENGQPATSDIVPTGHPILDDAIGGGLVRGQLTIIAGTPGSGKTALAMSIAQRVASAAAREAKITRRPERVLVVSLEMSGRQLAQRSLASLSGQSHTQIARGYVRDWGQAYSAADALGAIPLDVWPRSSPTPGQVVAKIFAAAAKGPLRAVVIDYFQILRFTVERGQRHDLAMGLGLLEICHACAEVGAALVLLSQFNRDKTRRGGPPRLSDLAECAMLERQAYHVLGLHRPHDDDPSTAEHWVHAHRLKSRGSPGAGAVVARFDGARMTFEFEGSADGHPSSGPAKDDIPF